MSKLIDKLVQVSQGTLQPIGFGTNMLKTKTPSMLLLARLQKADVSIAKAVKGVVDGLIQILPNLTDGKDSFRQILKSADEVPCGAFMEEITEKDVTALVKEGGDFLVLAPAKTPYPILEEENVGKILILESSLEEGLIRAVEEMAVDALLVEEVNEPSFTVSKLMVYQYLAGLTSKPLLATVPLDLNSRNLRGLQDAGITGIVTDITDARQKAELADLKKAIEGLPSPSREGRGKASVYLPFASLKTSDVSTEEEEEEEEEE